MKTPAARLIAIMAMVIAWAATPISIAQEVAPDALEAAADNAVPDEFQQLLDQAKLAEDEAPANEVTLVESIERVPDAEAIREEPSEPAPTVPAKEQLPPEIPPVVLDATSAEPVQVPSASPGNSETGSAGFAAVLVFLLVILVSAIVGLKFSRTYGWDAVVFVPSFFISNVWWAAAADFGQGSIAHLVVAVVAVLASGLASIWFRNRIMDWYSGGVWFTTGHGAVDVLFTNIWRRYGIELFIGVLSAALGWCGFFLLGLREIGRRESQHETVGFQVSVDA